MTKKYIPLFDPRRPVLLPVGEKIPDSQAQVIVINGLVDLPKLATKIIAESLKVDTFDPKWKTEISLQQKLNRLNERIQKAKNEDKPIFVVGLSAGALLALIYAMEHPGDICRILSVCGVLNPNGLDPKMRRNFIRDYAGFKQAANYFSPESNQDSANYIKRLHLPAIINAYSSTGDSFVTLAASRPLWIENHRFVGSADHAPAIARTVVSDIRSQLRQLRSARFD